MTNNFDFAVVGGGLFGSAATRHLATQGKNVVLFAPEEPTDVTSHDGVFASHYDEARITRILDVDELWSRFLRVLVDLANAGYPGCVGCAGPAAELPWDEMQSRRRLT